MKRMTIWLTACIFVILMMCMSGFLLMKNTSKSGMLRINRADITKDNVTIRYNHAMLPLTEVMKGLGMNVDWIDKSTAEIIHQGKKYILDLSHVTLVEVGENADLLISPPGGKRSYIVMDEELILDSTTMKGTMFLMGIKININIDLKEQLVCIVEKKD